MAFKVKTYIEYQINRNDEEKTVSAYSPFPFTFEGTITMLENGDLRFYGEVKNYVYWVFSLYLSPNEENGKRDVTLFYKREEDEFSVCFIEGEPCYYEFIEDNIRQVGTMEAIEIIDNVGEEGGSMRISAKANRLFEQSGHVEVKISFIPAFDA